MQFQSNPSAQLVLSFVMALRAVGIHVCLAGGAVRDITHGIVPRDFDLWVLPRIDGSLPNPNDIENAIAAAGLEPYADGGMYQGDYEGGALYVDYVLKYDVAGIDIIAMRNDDHSPVDNVQEVLAKFDFSINQQALVFDAEGGFTHVTMFDGEHVHRFGTTTPKVAPAT